MLNVAVIGLGWWGRTIAGLLQGNAKLRIVRVADVDTRAGAAFAATQSLAFSPSLDDVLADAQVQGVVLCTPHTQHSEQIIAVAQSGRHVFCEKPLCLSRAEVLRAMAAVEQHRVVLAVGHERRFEPPIAEALRLVGSGELGVPLQVEGNFSQDKFLALDAGNWRLSPKEAPAGPMTATGIHMLDLSIAVFGEAERVWASVKQLGSGLSNGDTLAALVSFKRGGHALLSAILATPFDGRFAVYCSQGWVEVRDKAHPEAPEGWTLTVSRQQVNGGRASRTDYAPASGVCANLEAFADAALKQAPYPVPRAQMVANISALEAIFKSARSGAIEAVEG